MDWGVLAPTGIVLVIATVERTVGVLVGVDVGADVGVAVSSGVGVASVRKGVGVGVIVAVGVGVGNRTTGVGAAFREGLPPDITGIAAPTNAATKMTEIESAYFSREIGFMPTPSPRGHRHYGDAPCSDGSPGAVSFRH